jgi:hypothetical protein
MEPGGPHPTDATRTGPRSVRDRAPAIRCTERVKLGYLPSVAGVTPMVA